MSGHSKWSQIKRAKGVADVKKGALFSKLAKAISLVVREGGSGDPDLNAKLRFAIEKAKASNMPNDNVQRAIQSGLGAAAGQGLEEIILEGYGPSGVAVMCRVVTDNRNRTFPEVRRIFQDHGGSLGEKGSAAYIFNPDPQNPIFTVPLADEKAAKQILALIDDLENHDDVNEVWSNFDISDEILQRVTD